MAMKNLQDPSGRPVITSAIKRLQQAVSQAFEISDPCLDRLDQTAALTWIAGREPLEQLVGTEAGGG